MINVYNLLPLKTRDNYTLKGYVDEIQSDRSLLQDDGHETSPSSNIIDMERVATGKQNLNAE